MTLSLTTPRGSAAEADERTLHIGLDPQGVMLEVITIPTNSGVLVIHAMPLRRKYRHLLD